MNARIKILATVLAAIAAGGAFAQEATPDTWIGQSTSVSSRQAIDAEARAARATGQIAFGEASGHDFSTRAGTRLSRAQVVAEAREAQRLGLIQSGEVQKFATASQLESIRRAGEQALGETFAAR